MRLLFFDDVGERPLADPLEWGGDCEADVWLPRRIVSEPFLRLAVCEEEEGPPRDVDGAVGSAALPSSCSSSASAENERLRFVPVTSVWMLRVVVDVVVWAEIVWDVEDAAAAVSDGGRDGWAVASGDVVDGCSSPARTPEV